jgi:hypothetical protein
MTECYCLNFEAPDLEDDIPIFIPLKEQDKTAKHTGIGFI